MGNQVRRLRKGQEISQYDLWKRSGLHMNYISDVELGKRNLSLTSICRLARGLKVKVRDLAREIDKEMPRDPRLVEKMGMEFPERKVISDLQSALELEEELCRRRADAGELTFEERELHRSLHETLKRALKREIEHFER